MPFHKQVNQWIHAHTSWKTFIHSCGSVRALIPDFIEAGFDILNPVQITAASMDRSELKQAFGPALTFWGGGIDTQHTLPNGTPAEIREEVQNSMRIFGKDGGFVFNPVHNVQPRVPVENLVALFRAVSDFRQ
jgi:uroporphyrinogen-III decarboxylase